MNTATLPNSTATNYDIEIPTWLGSCLIRQGKDDSPYDLCELGTTSLMDSPESIDLICRAFQFAYCLHNGQMRQSGEPYIAHPVAVAGILRELGGDATIIAAGFLHDVVEDTEVTLEDIEGRFGAEVRHLVEGVTKLSKFNFSSKTERQAENFRRMFLAMAQDIRVILVKLADRLHNMRTLEFMTEDKRRIKALETREIFAPLANRLGIGRLKWELEDLCFKYLETDAYRSIQTLVVEKRADREDRINQALDILRHRLDGWQITPVDISGRPKHLYSIYTKMQRQSKEFHEIYDVAALRIITNTIDECYRALAVVHDAFRPIPGRFKDYIGLPKPNRYQSLHTTVIGLSGRPMEVQIRTLEMHQIAEYGIAAHWKYKESGGSTTTITTNDEKFSWLRQLLDWQNDLKDATEYLENIKDNLFDEDVYVFTPKGEVMALGRSSTPIDFAYRIHTEVGNHCAGAKVNGRLVPLDTVLKNGDIVEVMTQNSAHPSMDWLNSVVTSGAKNRIRQWYKRSHRDENLLRGREMLEKEMGKPGFEALLKSEPMKLVADRCNYPSVDDLLAGLGYGETTLNHVVNRIRELIKAQQQESLQPTLAQEVALHIANQKTTTPPPGQGQCPIVGLEGMVYRIAGCCSPLPGEGILAAVSLGGRGISVHRQGCPSLNSIPGDRLMPVSWNSQTQTGRTQSYPVSLQLEVIDRVGVLKDVLIRLSDHSINVRKAQVNTSPDKPAIIDLCLDICNHNQLSQVSCQLKQMTDVLSLRRITSTEICH
ncbi:RelA/SpoT family protein [Prochlorothrix hollandica]|uniref:(P)ppGpp synthetase n=1 Tax=Prochlorothrix hollandica PCC 9006 = CALU 1027 TaxID=317619 RepID=A0A0M2PY46_PROHO|nr:bifunctional (p)ppGpp synthetase/guanosine-3',5'-bis(diphosphate) 3'-pyrophosphohydrolase [Prochlorothrix hollandica]KKJ01095.1 (p)ppGpp synthetase [Prochlorothrix hollandica PCC 9006 = CALU 1027]